MIDEIETCSTYDFHIIYYDLPMLSKSELINM